MLDKCIFFSKTWLIS